jgi:hypothetical protein
MIVDALAARSKWVRDFAAKAHVFHMIVPSLGSRFGRWRVDGPLSESGDPRRILVTCECGTTREVKLQSLVWGASKSCGCLRRERSGQRFAQRNRIHGHSVRNAESQEYKAWQAMLDRCRRPASKDPLHWRYYGSRQIGVCAEWRMSFKRFLADILAEIGPHPGPGYTFDRIDNNRGYEPGNVRWATKQMQMLNTRRNRRLTLAGVTLDGCRMGHRRRADRQYAPPSLETWLASGAAADPDRVAISKGDRDETAARRVVGAFSVTPRYLPRPAVGAASCRSRRPRGRQELPTASAVGACLERAARAPMNMKGDHDMRTPEKPHRLKDEVDGLGTLEPGWWVAVAFRDPVAKNRCYVGQVQAIDERGFRITGLDWIVGRAANWDAWIPWSNVLGISIATDQHRASLERFGQHATGFQARCNDEEEVLRDPPARETDERVSEQSEELR